MLASVNMHDLLRSESNDHFSQGGMWTQITYLELMISPPGKYNLFP